VGTLTTPADVWGIEPAYHDAFGRERQTSDETRAEVLAAMGVDPAVDHPSPGGDVLVVFRPETPERAFNAALKASGARIVGGPTEADAYVLSVPMAGRDSALATLRRRSEVVMAEPIEPSASP